VTVSDQDFARCAVQVAAYRAAEGERAQMRTAPHTSRHMPVAAHASERRPDMTMPRGMYAAYT